MLTVVASDWKCCPHITAQDSQMENLWNRKFWGFKSFFYLFRIFFYLFILFFILFIFLGYFFFSPLSTSFITTKFVSVQVLYCPIKTFKNFKQISSFKLRPHTVTTNLPMTIDTCTSCTGRWQDDVRTLRRDGSLLLAPRAVSLRQHSEVHKNKN